MLYFFCVKCLRHTNFLEHALPFVLTEDFLIRTNKINNAVKMCIKNTILIFFKSELTEVVAIKFLSKYETLNV